MQLCVPKNSHVSTLNELGIAQCVLKSSISSSETFSPTDHTDNDLFEKISNCGTYLMRPKIEKPHFMSESLYKLYNAILFTLPEFVESERKKKEIIDSGVQLEVCDLNEKFVDFLSKSSEEDIGSLYVRTLSKYNIKKQFTMTVKELFIIIVLELGIFFKRAVSYQFLEKIIFGSPKDFGDDYLQVP